MLLLVTEDESNFRFFYFALSCVLCVNEWAHLYRGKDRINRQ